MRGAEPPTDPPAYKLPLFQHMATERSVRELCPVSGTRLPSVNDRSTIRKSARAREAHCGGLAELEPSMMGKLVPVVYGEQSVAPFDEPFAGLCCTNPVWDSSHESSVVAGIHEQTYTPDLQDQELASLQ